MGLDTYASRQPDEIELSDEDAAAFEAAAIRLCGGFWSGGDASFRGKVYDDLIRDATGQSLYREWIPPEEVQAMAEALGAPTPEALAALSAEVDGQIDPSRAHSELECADLQAFFRLCADRGLGLIGWW